MFGRLLYFGMLLLGGVLIVSAQEVKEGLRVTFSPKGESKVLDAVVLPNVRLYVPAGEAATPLMKPGPFTATWSGFLTLEMRSQYAFQAESSGAVKVDLNGSTVLEVAEGSKEVTPGKVVRLNKGTNQITVVFTAPASGDAFLRLYWIPKDALPTPLPDVGFNHLPDAELLQHLAIHQGRGLFLEHRCGKCHLPGMMGDTAELQMDAPTFSGIGSRRNFAWMRDWILDPKKQRATARMPRIFHGPEAAADATAVAAYLASLKVESGSPSGTKGTAEQIESGKKRFEALHCAACHTSPEESQVDVARPSLAHVRAKFPEGELARFILKPEAHYAWTRMPRFKLSEAQAAELAAYLESKAVEPATASADAGLVEKGRKLVQSSGCINCHTAELENQFKTKALADIPASRWNQGCVTKSEKSPHFGFSPEQVKALVAFAETDRESLSRHVDREFASRQSLNLRCVECHGKFEGFPHFDILGGKLKPEWSARFIAGEVAEKQRPWIEAQMPAFPKYAAPMAKGLAKLHGYPASTPEEGAIDREAAKIGQKLVSADGGFSCVACHAVGDFGATQVFESAGINLAYSGERLLKPFYHRWLLNPIAIDPTSKMPVYFDEQGKSPLTDIYEGDGEKTREAIWQYLRMGKEMPAPVTPQ